MGKEKFNKVETGFSSRRGIPIPCPHLVSFYKEGEMGVPKKCQDCIDYNGQLDHADIVETYFGQSGIWDLKTCRNTCWQEIRTRQNINNLAYYHRKVGH